MSTGELRRPMPSAARHALSKVPEVTVLFWITKVLTTGMGEVLSDFLAKTIDPVIAVGIGFVGFAFALWLQFRVQKYLTWVYWLAVTMVSVFGTMAADVLHVVVGIPYIVSSTFYAVVLTVIFLMWYRTEKTLSIHSIFTRRREAFYWLTVLATFALGTAVGDLTATTFGLGYFASGVLFAVAIAIPAIGYGFNLNSIFAFWFAYVLTRPLGASFADWAAVSHARGGLNLGLGPVSLVLTVAIAACVGVLAVTRKDVKTS